VANWLDQVIAYVVPEDSWFVIPVKAFAPRKSLRLYPKGDRRGTIYGLYREAWWFNGGRSVPSQS